MSDDIAKLTIFDKNKKKMFIFKEKLCFKQEIDPATIKINTNKIERVDILTKFGFLFNSYKTMIIEKLFSLETEYFPNTKLEVFSSFKDLFNINNISDDAKLLIENLDISNSDAEELYEDSLILVTELTAVSILIDDFQLLIDSMQNKNIFERFNLENENRMIAYLHDDNINIIKENLKNEYEIFNNCTIDTVLKELDIKIKNPIITTELSVNSDTFSH